MVTVAVESDVTVEVVMAAVVADTVVTVVTAAIPEAA